MNQPSETREPVEQLAEEFLERRRQGERVSARDYAEAYPKLAEEILDLFPTMLALEDMGDEKLDGAGDAEPAAAFEHPARLGDLKLLREIGRGGMGIVYEAEQESLGRRVAVKILPERALFDTKRLERFRREARTAGGLQHPNIVPIYGVGEQDGLHYLSMQLVEGAGLDVLADLVGAKAGGASSVATGPVTAGPATEGPATAGPNAMTVDTAPAGGAVASGGAGADDTRSAGWFAESLAEAMVADDFHATSSVDLSAPTLAGPLPPGSSGSGNDAPTIDLSHLTHLTQNDSGDSASIYLEEAARSIDASGDRHRVGADYFRSVAKIGVQAAEALAYAHARGTLHRDIKPANLLLDRRGSVWITDFGLAKAMEDNSVSRTGELVGTLRYMAPEQLRGDASPRSDLYSLGLTLYELVAWRPAFEAPAPSELIRKIAQDGPVPPSRLNPRLPRDLETIILKAIARDPEERYQTGDDLAADLRRFMEGIPVAAQRDGAAQRVLRWTRANPLVAGLGAAAVLLGCTTVAATAVLLGGPPPPRPAPTAGVSNNGAAAEAASMAPALPATTTRSVEPAEQAPGAPGEFAFPRRPKDRFGPPFKRPERKRAGGFGEQAGAPSDQPERRAPLPPEDRDPRDGPPPLPPLPPEGEGPGFGGPGFGPPDPLGVGPGGRGGPDRRGPLRPRPGERPPRRQR